MDEESPTSRPRRSSRRLSVTPSQATKQDEEEVMSGNESDASLSSTSSKDSTKKKKKKAKTTKAKAKTKKVKKDSTTTSAAGATKATKAKTTTKRKATTTSKPKSPAKKKKTSTTKVEPQRITEQDELTPKWNPETDTQTNQSYNFKIISWNVAGLRALLKNHPNALPDLAKNHDADVICLQETKLQEQHVDDAKLKIGGHLLVEEGYDGYYSCSTAKKGYSGVAVFIKKRQVKDASAGAASSSGGKKKKTQAKMGDFFTKPKKTEAKEGVKETADDNLPIDVSNLIPVNVSKEMSIEEHDQEGRIITVDLPLFSFANLYVPNSGQKLERLKYRTESWDSDLLSFMQAKQKERGVPVCWLGDLNVAHKSLDVWNDGAKHLAKQSGTTPEERDSFQRQLDVDEGDKKASVDDESSLSPFVDTFRHLYPDAKGHYTYWSQRAGNRAPNKGLRLDYFVCSRDFFDNGEGDQKAIVRDSYMIPEQLGSDHCPVVLEIEIRK